MPLIGTVKEKKQYTLKFDADASNTGNTMIAVGWVPRKPGSVVPPPAQGNVPPGLSWSWSGVAPAVADARNLRVAIALPPGGSGKLTLTQPNEADQSTAINNNDDYLYVVVP